MSTTSILWSARLSDEMRERLGSQPRLGTAISNDSPHLRVPEGHVGIWQWNVANSNAALQMLVGHWAARATHPPAVILVQEPPWVSDGEVQF